MNQFAPIPWSLKELIGRPGIPRIISGKGSPRLALEDIPFGPGIMGVTLRDERLTCSFVLMMHLMNH